MSLIFTSLAHDPSAVAECLAAALTACYVGKLTFSSSEAAQGLFSPRAGLSRNRLPSNSKAICRVLSDSNRKVSKGDFGKRFLRLFAVGELVPLPKKSLRFQNTFWHR
ncbi:MAG: hypothetical protein U0136_09545 [Bdellovibrionota bacterium]